MKKLKTRACMDIPAEILSRLPMEEILSRLPVKTLLRFKSVCRGWFSLIGSRSFAEHHFRQAGKAGNQQLLVDPDNLRNEYFCIYPQLDEKVRSHILGPANGVFCEVREDGTLILSNPGTREIRTVLPPLPFSSFSSVPLPVDEDQVSVRVRIRAALAFGFGLDPLSGAFKIVAFTKTTARELAPAACVIYNSSTNSWKHLVGVGDSVMAMVMNAAPRAKWNHRQSKYLNGVYYWLLRSCELSGRDDAAVLAFDMVSEEFREVIPAPERGRLKFWNLHIQVYRDSLALMTVYELGECRCVDLWVMVGEVWKYNFSSGPFQDDTAWLFCMWSKTNRHELFLETLDFSDQIPSHLSTRMLRIGRDELLPADANPQYEVIPYKETLFSIKGHYT